MTKDEIQEKALNVLSKVTRGTIAMSVGTGKTLVGLKYMDRLLNKNTMFLVVAPKKAIFKSWKDDAVKFGMEHLLPHIKFSTYLSLSKQDLNYRAVILDEAHSILESNEAWLDTYIGNLIGLTGTPPKFVKSYKGELFNKYIPVVFKYLTDKAVDDKILNDYEIIVHKVKLNTKQNIKTGKSPKTFYTSELASYTYWTNRCAKSRPGKELQIASIMRMKAMMSFKSKDEYAKKLLNDTDDKIILFANTHEQADSFGIDSYHSKNSNSEYILDEFKSGLITKMSCVLQLNEGINIPHLKEGIILHAYSGNSAKTHQRFGRLLRLNPVEKCTLHILCYEDTIDETWVKSCLENLNQSKIKWL